MTDTDESRFFYANAFFHMAHRLPLKITWWDRLRVIAYVIPKVLLYRPQREES